MNLKPYLAIDIETTGLDREKSLVLQVAAVWDDGSQSLSDLRKFSVLVVRPTIFYGEPYALHLNAGLLEQMAKGVGESIESARTMFRHFVHECNDARSVVVAGKNVAGFDIPILRNNGFDVSLFKHRVIDPGSLYLPDFGTPPSMDQINELTGRKPVSHDALSDCFDVVCAIRHKFGLPIK